MASFVEAGVCPLHLWPTRAEQMSWQLRCEEGVDALSRCEAEQEHRLMHQAGTGSIRVGYGICQNKDGAKEANHALLER